ADAFRVLKLIWGTATGQNVYSKDLGGPKVVADVPKVAFATRPAASREEVLHRPDPGSTAPGIP
ncbi:hypothetical protein AB0E54_42040, partial [Amycolatopsis coloradensis]